jgi:hypothetical protein
MKASEFIEGLQALIQQHGDLDLQDDGGNEIDIPEFYNEDDVESPIFLIVI